MTISGSKRRLAATLGGLFTAALLAGAAMAQEAAQCQWQAPLLSLSDTVLTRRVGLPPLQVRSYGSEAAYLKIRYGGHDDIGNEAMLDQLADAHARYADDLRLAWYVANQGIETAPDTLGEDALDLITSGAGLSSIRAVLAAGDIEALLDRLALKSAAEQAAAVLPIVTAVIDFPDAYKALLVRDALAAGDISLAVAVVASAKDRKALKSFAPATTQAEEYANWVRAWRWLPAIYGNPALPVADDDTAPERVKTRADIQAITAAGALEPEFALLPLYLNQTGETAETLAVATAFADMIGSGAIPARGSLDTGWLFVFRSLSAELGADHVRAVLGPMTLTTGRYGQRTIGEVLDRIIAIDTLRPYLTGATTTPPAPPLDVSVQFGADWAHWLDLASRVKVAPDAAALGANADDFSIIAELLFAAGNMDALAAAIAAAPASPQTVAIASDFAKRLDRLCSSYLWHPAEALLLGGQPIFKFDSQYFRGNFT